MQQACPRAWFWSTATRWCKSVRQQSYHKFLVCVPCVDCCWCFGIGHSKMISSLIVQAFCLSTWFSGFTTQFPYRHCVTSSKKYWLYIYFCLRCACSCTSWHANTIHSAGHPNDAASLRWSHGCSWVCTCGQDMTIILEILLMPVRLSVCLSVSIRRWRWWENYHCNHAFGSTTIFFPLFLCCSWRLLHV